MIVVAKYHRASLTCRDAYCGKPERYHPMLILLSCGTTFLVSFSFFSPLFSFRYINNNYFYGAVVDVALVPADAETNWKMSSNCLAFLASPGSSSFPSPSSSGVDISRRSECPSFCLKNSGVPSSDRAICRESSPALPLPLLPQLRSPIKQARSRRCNLQIRVLDFRDQVEGPWLSQGVPREPPACFRGFPGNPRIGFRGFPENACSLP